MQNKDSEMEAKYYHYEGIDFRIETPRPLAELLTRLYSSSRRKSRRIRVWFGYAGHVWQSEYGTSGYLGRTGVTLKVMLLLNNARSLGAPELDTDRIMRIDDTRTGATLYTAPGFVLPDYTVKTPSTMTPEYKADVFSEGELIGRFFTPEQARRFADYMSGKRYNP